MNSAQSGNPGGFYNSRSAPGAAHQREGEGGGGGGTRGSVHVESGPPSVTRRACVRVYAPSVAACGGNVYVALSQIHLSSARKGKRRVGACAHITSHNALTRTHARTSPFLSNPHKWQWMAECK